MPEPTFLTLDEIKLIHENQIQLYGGSLGIRDEPAVISALEAPRWAYQYGQTDWVELAAIYFYHLMMNHGFTDGNKAPLPPSSSWTSTATGWKCLMENWNCSRSKLQLANWRKKKSPPVYAPTSPPLTATKNDAQSSRRAWWAAKTAF